MEQQFQILELFPTPVLAITIPEQYSGVTEYFSNQEMASTTNPNSVDVANYGDRSTNSYILDEPECIHLKTYILGLTKEFGKALGYTYDSYRFGQSWISLKHTNTHTHTHTPQKETQT